MNLKKTIVVALLLMCIFSSVCYAWEDIEGFKPLAIYDPQWEFYYKEDFQYRDYSCNVCEVWTMAINHEKRTIILSCWLVAKDRTRALTHQAEYNIDLGDFVRTEDITFFKYEPIIPDTVIDKVYYIVFP